MFGQARVLFSPNCINLGFGFSSDLVERSMGRSNGDLLKHSTAIAFVFVVYSWYWAAIGVIWAAIHDAVKELCRGSSNGTCLCWQSGCCCLYAICWNSSSFQYLAMNISAFGLLSVVLRRHGFIVVWEVCTIVQYPDSDLEKNILTCPDVKSKNSHTCHSLKLSRKTSQQDTLPPRLS